MVGNRFFSMVLVFLGMYMPTLHSQAQSTIKEGAALQRMLEVYAQKNKSRDQVKAWRIQVGAMTDRRQMEYEMERFENIFPYYELEWTYDNPYYLLKIMDRAFKNKLDALSLLHEVKDKYPSAIVILDDVPRDDLLKMSEN